MAIRCLLFTSDEGAAAPIRAVLTALGVEGEFHSDGMTAADRISAEPFQIVILDWDAQPDAGSLLRAARDRKANERPLTLAIVSDDANVPKALHAGANSILRKPLLVNQVHDTLSTARDLAQSKVTSAANVAAAAAVVATGEHAPQSPPAPEGAFRAGEFLPAAGPSTAFDKESEMQKSMDEAAVQQIDPLKDLEPTAAAVAGPPIAPADDGPRGLEYYMKARGLSRDIVGHEAPPPAPAAGPELMGFDQTASASAAAPARAREPEESVPPRSDRDSVAASREQQAEKLFAYIAGESEETENKPKRQFRLGKGTIVFAGALAACAIAFAPQAPWHRKVHALAGRGQQVLHAWLNPQPVVTPAAPVTHETFGRAGDEYKLPVAEAIPDATTDPSHIQVLPVTDPTAKKDSTAADPTTGAPDGSSATPDGTQPQAIQVQENPQGETSPNQTAPNQNPESSSSQAPQQNPVSESRVPENPAPPVVTQPVSSQPRPTVAAPQSLLQPMQPGTAVATNPSLSTTTQPAPSKVPSSLKSQIASMRPDIGGNKAPETALDSIEPVSVTEAAERALLADQPAIPYPDAAKGQPGTVSLQVLIGRDGSVQDAKFLQGSLAFARVAIDGVKQWRFRPYMMNARPTAVQTTLTLSFKPGQ